MNDKVVLIWITIFMNLGFFLFGQDNDSQLLEHFLIKIPLLINLDLALLIFKNLLPKFDPIAK